MGSYRRTLPAALTRQETFRNYQLEGNCRIVATFGLCRIHGTFSDVTVSEKGDAET